MSRTERSSEPVEGPQSELLLVALESASTGVLIASLNGRIEWVNSAFARVTGYTPQQLAGRHLRVLRPRRSSGAVYRDLWETVSSGREWSGDLILRRRDGTVCEASFRVTPRPGACGKPGSYLAVHHEIRPRERSEREYHRLFHVLQDGLSLREMIFDATGRPVDYRFLSVNPAFERMVGRPAAELIGKTAREVFSSVDAQAIVRYGHVCLTGETVHFESCTEPDGRHFEVTAYRTGANQFAAVVVDTTTQKETAERLRQSEERYRLLFNATNDAILVPEVTADGRLGRFVEANDVACTLLGRPHEQVLCMTPDDILVPDDAARIPEVVAELLCHGHTLWQAENRLPDGRTLPLEVSTHLFELEGRQVAVSVMRDLTERKRSEEALQRLQEQFRQAQKLESIGRLAGGMAHDFNNLLTIINGYSALLVRGLDPRDPFSDHAAAIRQAGEKAASLTRQLLAFSRHQVMQLRPLDLNAVVADTERMLHRLIGEDIELALALDPMPSWTRADSGQINQVLMNLVINARDAMPGGGTIVIETGRENQKGESQGYVTLTVRDTGCGMNEETRQRAFEPFFTTKPMGVGTGLGLSTVYGIVRQNGGTVLLESEPGKGTAVKILLPAIDPPPEVRQKQEVSPVGQQRGTETILLVEDQAEVRILAQRLLLHAGYRVLGAANGDEALRLAGLHSGSIHLMITDVVMPVMNGCELANRLHRMRPEIKVLFMSGYMDQVVLHRDGVSAEVAFLQKPFTPESLTAKAREVLGPPWNAPKILVVDDDPEIRRFLAREIQEAGYRVAEAGNGNEALRRLREVRFALALIDLVMPEKEGIETICEVSRLHPGLPVVAMSGAFGGNLLEPTRRLGAAATLAKPIETKELRETLHRFLN